jgi:hypothetical protein
VRSLGSTYAECIGDAIDVVEPARDQRDLQDAAIIEAGFAQTLVVLRADACCVTRELHDVVEHNAIAFLDGGFAVVVLQRSDQAFIQRDPTQKLCVRVDSIPAPVCN